MHAVSAFFGRGDFLPHGYCFTWTPSLLWSMVGADAIIAASYFSIPVALTVFLRARRDVALNWVGWLFGAFIFACGTTHVMDIWTIWRPDYGLQAATKAATAAVSLVTALALWPLLPRALKIPSVAQLRAAIHSLEDEIAKRRSADDLAAEAQENLALTLASIDAGFVAIDAAGRVRRLNRVAERLLGWPEAEAAGRSFWEVFQREGRPPWFVGRNPVDLLVEQNLTVDTALEVVLVSRDGLRTSVELKAGLTHAVDGSVNGVAVVFRDIGALQRAAAESSRLAAIVESSYDAVIGKTLDGRITSWNQSAQTLFGHAADEAIGQSVQILIPPERAAEEMRIISELSRGARVASFDTVRLTKDGRRIEVSVTISPIRDAQGRIVGASKIARDVTAQRRAEAALRESERRSAQLEAENRNIQESNRLKSLFLANMSHELRTPLNAVIGFAELLKDRGSMLAATQRDEFVGHIARSGRHLLALINDVLDLAKVESGRFEFFPAPIDLPALVADVAGTMGNATRDKRLVLGIEIEPAVAALHLDAGRLRQVLYNYLSNAIKFTPPGGRIAVRACAEGAQHVRIEVEDDGIGIALDEQPRLFTEFQQIDAGLARRHEGTGLGLALTRRLVEAQGGSVGVRSAPGKGSVFHVVLPRVHDVSAAATSAPDDPWLVVENARHPQAGLSAALARAGRQVDAAATAGEAVSLAARRPYGAIALDLMPSDGAGGLQVLADIRAQGPNRLAPVVGVTLAPAPLRLAGFAVDDVLAKPIRIDEVRTAVGRLRARGRARLRVMVVDDDPRALELMTTALAALAVETVGFLDAPTALVHYDREPPDAIVLDLMLPGMDGFAMLDALRRRPTWAGTPVLIWTSLQLTGAQYATLARSAGAVVEQGGGTLETLLDDWRRRGVLQASPAPEGEPS